MYAGVFRDRRDVAKELLDWQYAGSRGTREMWINIDVNIDVSQQK